MANQPDPTALPIVPAKAAEFTAGLLNAVKPAVEHPLAGHARFVEQLAEGPRPRTIACMVTHGMGQQVPFETVSLIGEAFVRGRTPLSVNANRVQLTPDADLLSRLEIVYAADATTPETHVHLYEGYWAPLTAGKITYAQSLSFLFSGAGAGIVSAVKRKFDRWIFGKMYDLPAKKHTFFILIVVLLVLAVGLGLAYLGGLQFARLLASLKPLASIPYAEVFPALLKIFNCSWLAILRTLLLVAVIFVYRYFLRLFIIDYLGSVAIYVSSYKVSSFQEVREAIQAAVFSVASQIFQATGPDGSSPTYEQVIFLGHSLGSVITYDLINALIVWDSKSCGGSNNVLGRISQLITFGSPLDKTAFLFRTQISPEHHYREALAALQQPLVLDYRLRPFPWINLYSHADIVSGHLVYYDVPTPPPTAADPNPMPIPEPIGYNPVQNVIDPAAHTPILAHTQYWNGDLLSCLLISAIQPPPR
jgi:hypothetical protein